MRPHFRPIRLLIRHRFETTITALAALFILVLVPTDAGSAIGWRGDFENGSFSQWNYGVQTKHSSRATIVTSVAGGPVRQGRYAARYEVQPGDNNVSGSGMGERTEALISGQPTGAGEGVEQFWAWSTYFPEDFDSPAGAWNVFTQFHHDGTTGQSNIHFELKDKTTIGLRVMGGSVTAPVRRDFTLANLQRGKWYDFVFRVKWSSSGSGFVEAWVDGSRVLPLVSTPTLYSGQNVYLKQGYYRAAYDKTTVIYHDGMRRGTSYAEVAAEFPPGGEIPPPPPPPSSTAPVNSTAPAVSGQASEGSALSASTGSWNNTPTSYAYQWQSSLDAGASWASVTGATLKTFNNTATFVNRHVRVIVTAANSSGSTASTSTAVGPIAPIAPITVSLPPSNSAAPVISGETVVGSTLTATQGIWNNEPTSYSYQWQSSRNGGASWASVSGATLPTFDNKASFMKRHIRVIVTATNSSGSSAATSNAAGPIDKR